MQKITGLLFLTCLLVQCASDDNTKPKESAEFPDELVHFVAYQNNPVFTGAADTTAWDTKIRERGFILKEDSVYYMWYTGYQNNKDEKYLGVATSIEGYHWQRFSDRPVYDASWVEDLFVLKSDSLYYMFAEGSGDTAHLLTSSDRIHWTEKGPLDIRQTNGQPIAPGPFGTPTVWKEGDTWYLFYERNDLGIWLATSKDLKIWTNVQDHPVIKMGPETYDKYAIAMNQVVKHNGLYYAYYHASAFEDWHEWSVNVAVSKDLIHWKKYPGNPIIKENKSSGILVWDGKRNRLYTMHKEVAVHFPVTDSLP